MQGNRRLAVYEEESGLLTYLPRPTRLSPENEVHESKQVN